MPGRVIRMLVVTEAVVRGNPEWLFVFGDNMDGSGFGGQARAMRGKPNAIGVPTKWKPTMGADAFFQDRDFAYTAVRAAITEPFRRVRRELVAGRTVVIPAAGLGTGLAELPKRAPLIHGYIGGWIAALEDIAAGEGPGAQGEEDHNG